MSGQERPLPPVDNMVDLQETTESTRQPNVVLRAGGTLAAVGALGMGLVAVGGGSADGEAAGWSPVEINDVFCVNDQLGYWQIVSSVRSDHPTDTAIDGQDFVATPGNFIDAELRDDEDEVLAYGVWGSDVDSANISFNVTYPGAPGEVDAVSVSGERPEDCGPDTTTTTTSTTTTTTTQPTTTTTQPEHKVDICHATNSASNPYVKLNVAVSSVDGDAGNNNGQGDHYLEHTGPIFDAEVHNQQNRGWGDIIPAIDGIHDGLNWDAEGQAVYEDDCEVDDDTTTTTTSTTTTSTTTTTQPTTTTTQPTTTTTRPTTTTTQPTTTTTQPTTTTTRPTTTTTQPTTTTTQPTTTTTSTTVPPTYPQGS